MQHARGLNSDSMILNKPYSAADPLIDTVINQALVNDFQATQALLQQTRANNPDFRLIDEDVHAEICRETGMALEGVKDTEEVLHGALNTVDEHEHDRDFGIPNFLQPHRAQDLGNGSFDGFSFFDLPVEAEAPLHSGTPMLDANSHSHNFGTFIPGSSHQWQNSVPGGFSNLRPTEAQANGNPSNTDLFPQWGIGNAQSGGYGHGQRELQGFGSGGQVYNSDRLIHGSLAGTAQYGTAENPFDLTEVVDDSDGLIHGGLGGNPQLHNSDPLFRNGFSGAIQQDLLGRRDGSGQVVDNHTRTHRKQDVDTVLRRQQWELRNQQPQQSSTFTANGH